MDEARRYIPNHQSELEQILQEAQHRWLRPAEICEILRNYKRFSLRPDPPVQPPAGSLFLFDRKALRYFRNDGHRWRKKKDGKTVKEAHEKLKAGSVNVLHCYYAHGEDNDNFQRRSYWMLDGQLEHIVLVHYREVKEGYKSGISRLPVDPGSQIGSPQSSSAPYFSQANSPAPTVQTSYASSPIKVGWSGQTLSSEFEDVDSGDDPVPFSRALVQSIYGSMSHNASLPAHQVLGIPGSSSDHSDSRFAAAKFDPATASSVWTNIQTPSRNVDSLHETKFHVDKKLYVEQPSGADFLTHKLTDARLDSESELTDVVTCGDRLITDDAQAVPSSSERLVQAPQEHGFDILRPYFQNYSGPQTVIASATQVENKSGVCGANNNESGGLKKLDSFGRWMDKEIGRDCDDSLMASDSGNYWNALDTENDDKEVSSLSRQMQLDIDSLAPSLSQEQLFSICDFSPDWAYYGVETKVLIVGSFLGSKRPSTGNKWGCMFGEFEVSAEVLTNTTIRCQAPLHAPGRVPFYVTCSNRLACSEVREFEYREKPAGIANSMAVISAPEEEVRFQTRLAKLLYLGPERMWSDCSVESCDKCKLKTAIYSMSNRKNDWKRVEGTSMAVEADHINSRDILIENMLKDRLPLWLAYKVHERGKGPHILDDEGQGVIHLAAALGYEWAMGPIVAAGVNPNFRDARGRTGLHWASYFGREEMVITLIRLGAAPGAVDDPTPAFPGGQKAADLASSRGNKGIAGYLAEADLINHLSSMSVNENVMSGVAANIAAEKAIETATEIVLSSGSLNEDVSLKGSLAAVRKSAYAAALIQDAFRARSFHHRQLTVSADDSSESSLDLVALGVLNKVRKGNYEDYLHSAAAKIQQKYRGWKGRKEFLKIRNRIVKIQAHVRGHQVRKHYKKVVWSVGIMEKLILRWRRKGAGLRGFRGEKATGNMVPETKKTDEYEFLRIGRKQKFAGFEKALARVKSMVRDPEAREQYMRMATKFENLKMGDEGSSSVSQQLQTSQKSRTEEDLAIFTVATKPG